MLTALLVAATVVLTRKESYGSEIAFLSGLRPEESKFTFFDSGLGATKTIFPPTVQVYERYVVTSDLKSLEALATRDLRGRTSGIHNMVMLGNPTAVIDFDRKGLLDEKAMSLQKIDATHVKIEVVTLRPANFLDRARDWMDRTLHPRPPER